MFVQQSRRLLGGFLRHQLRPASVAATATHSSANTTTDHRPLSQHLQQRRGVATNEAQQLQEAALEENCILVDEHDRSLGYGSKRDCHRVGADGQIKLHRAFSVFLFNSAGDMLLQKRSSHKVSQVLSSACGRMDTTYYNMNCVYTLTTTASD